jgi:8-oxo-dGTP pyrophosphatase MutT (NUDIX family)
MIQPKTAITALSRLEARLEPVDWDFNKARRPEIEAHWQKLIAEKPQMFNGTVLMQHDWSLQDGIYSTAYTPVDYASFVAWIQFGQPGSPRRNGFAMAALQAADGAFVLGVMAGHTVNAGKIYFPGGTPDLHDVTADNRVDLAGSLTRELFEETGLRPDEVVIDDRWVLVTESYRAAFLKPARLAYDAETARRIIVDRLATQTDQELADMHIVRQPSDIIESRTPEFAAAYMRWVFGQKD